MEIVYETPVLTTETAPGKRRYWQGRVLEDAGELYTQALWWASKGAVQESTPKLVAPVTRHGGYVVPPMTVAIEVIEGEADKCRKKYYTEVTDG